MGDVAIVVDNDSDPETSCTDNNAYRVENQNELNKLKTSLNTMANTISRSISQKSIAKLLSEEDKNTDSQLLLSSLLGKFRSLKWLYGHTAKGYSVSISQLGFSV
ncbi:uncharacterized protein LOC142354531 [Convolutriloba macropyga]|uniref:uncharacterized protein LOC142354531 n=1 Tax=Convolutriloba macropyga TaxID=536237 RepID=UPI003F51BADD